MKIELRVKVRAQNEILAQLADDFGGIKRIAAELGYCPGVYGNWLNFRRTPRIGGKSSMKTEKGQKLVLDLERLTGRNIKEIFPDLTKLDLAALAGEKVYNKTITVEQLRDQREVQQLTYDQPCIVEKKEMSEGITRALGSLSYREREIIKLRYGLGDGYSYTLEEVSHIFRLTVERIRQLEKRALRRLSRGAGGELLSKFMEETECQDD